MLIILRELKLLTFYYLQPANGSGLPSILDDIMLLSIYYVIFSVILQKVKQGVKQRLRVIRLGSER